MKGDQYKAIDPTGSICRIYYFSCYQCAIMSQIKGKENAYGRRKDRRGDHGTGR